MNISTSIHVDNIDHMGINRQTNDSRPDLIVIHFNHLGSIFMFPEKFQEFRAMINSFEFENK